MINKIITDVNKVFEKIKDGQSILIGGQTNLGMPHNLLNSLLENDVKNLELICNYAGIGNDTLSKLFEKDMVRKIICSYPRSPFGETIFTEKYKRGEIDLEVVPQGTLTERIRAGGAGIGGFYTKTGVGTIVAKNKETKIINGEKYLFEQPITADFALIKAYKADRFGNLIYRKAARNYNPTMATAGKITIVEVEEIVPEGELNPEEIITPGIYVNYVIQY